MRRRCGASQPTPKPLSCKVALAEEQENPGKSGKSSCPRGSTSRGRTSAIPVASRGVKVDYGRPAVAALSIPVVRGRHSFKKQPSKNPPNGKSKHFHVEAQRPNAQNIRHVAPRLLALRRCKGGPRDRLLLCKDTSGSMRVTNMRF